MLKPIAPDLWHAQHRLRFMGLAITARMTVVRLPGDRLWLHSPVHLTPELSAQLAEIGRVAHVVAPSKSHSAFVHEYLTAYPDARFYGAPGLGRMKPALASLKALDDTPEPEWAGQLDQTLFRGIPVLNEVVWFHEPTRSLILTDLCQWIRGDLPRLTRVFARLTGVYQQLAMPLQLKVFVKDKTAARASRERLLAWPFERVIVAHDVILESGAREAVARAMGWLG